MNAHQKENIEQGKSYMLLIAAGLLLVEAINFSIKFWS